MCTAIYALFVIAARLTQWHTVGYLKFDFSTKSVGIVWDSKHKPDEMDTDAIDIEFRRLQSAKKPHGDG